MVKSTISIITTALLISGCTSQHEECIEREKQQYRSQNPSASYGQVQSRQADFELMCSKFKGK